MGDRLPAVRGAPARDAPPPRAGNSAALTPSPLNKLGSSQRRIGAAPPGIAAPQNGGTIADVLAERDAQIATLHGQVAHLRACLDARVSDAKAYQHQLDAMAAQMGSTKELSAEHAQRVTEESRTQLARLSEQTSRAQAALRQTRNELEATQEQLRVALDESSALLDELTAARDEADAARQQRDSAERKLAALREHSGQLERELAAAKEEAQGLRTERAGLAQAHARLTESERHSRAQVDTLRADSHAARQQGRALEHALRAAIEHARSEQAAAASQLHAAHDARAGAIANAEQLGEVNTVLGKRLAAAEAAARDAQLALSTALSAEESRAHAIAEHVQRMSAELLGAQQGLASLSQLRTLEHAEVSDLRQRLYSLERSAHAREGHLTSLEHGARSLQHALERSAALLLQPTQRGLSGHAPAEQLGPVAPPGVLPEGPLPGPALAPTAAVSAAGCGGGGTAAYWSPVRAAYGAHPGAALGVVNALMGQCADPFGATAAYVPLQLGTGAGGAASMPAAAVAYAGLPAGAGAQGSCCQPNSSSAEASGSGAGARGGAELQLDSFPGALSQPPQPDKPFVRSTEAGEAASAAAAARQNPGVVATNTSTTGASAATKHLQNMVRRAAAAQPQTSAAQNSRHHQLQPSEVLINPGLLRNKTTTTQRRRQG